MATPFGRSFPPPSTSSSSSYRDASVLPPRQRPCHAARRTRPPVAPISQQRFMPCASASGPGQQPAGGGAPQPISDALLQFMSILQESQRAQQKAPQEIKSGDCLRVKNVSFQPPGSASPLLKGVSLVLPPKSLGLVYGRSGSGKTTLLNVVAGLMSQTAGDITILAEGPGLPPHDPASSMTAAQRLPKAGMVFQFPERHFLGNTLIEELIVGLPREVFVDQAQRQAASLAIQSALASVGMTSFTPDTPLRALSDGYKRRLALAVQLMRRPSVLLLDEPLAGLDWKARRDLAGLLGRLKTQCSILAVSHDLTELSGLADCAFEMKAGGELVTADAKQLLAEMEPR